MRNWILSLFLFFIGSVASATEPIEGKDYILVKPQAPTSLEKIEVIDFFSYTCGHCFRLSPLIETWSKELPQDVHLIHSPVAWDGSSQFLANVYFTFEAMSHLDDLHPAFWQDIMAGKITSSDSLTQWFKAHGIEPEKWDEVYQSFSVKLSTQQAAQRWQDYQIDATPYIGVAGKYLTAPHLAGSRQKTIEVLNWLIEKERKDRQKNH